MIIKALHLSAEKRRQIFVNGFRLFYTFWMLVFIILGIIILSSCTATFPMGKDAQLGYIRGSIEYLPPIDLYQSPRFLGSDK